VSGERRAVNAAPPGVGPARLVLVTGKGGVGKTTLAAATALACADAGYRTCVASTDTAHSLGEVLDADLGGSSVSITERLDAVHVDAREQLRSSWSAMEDHLRALAARAGVGAVQAGELATVPGLDDVLTLAAVVDLAEGGDYDVVVVDCAASAETVRLLSLPHVLGWWLERLLPTFPDLGPLAPLLEAGLGTALPGKDTLAAGHALLERLRRAERVLNAHERTSVRLVTTPEQVVVAETRRTATYLSLFGYAIDAVVANRVLAEQGDGWWERWRHDQQVQLERLRTDVAPAPVLESPMLDGPAVGSDALRALGEVLYGDSDPVAGACRGPVVSFEPAGEPSGAGAGEPDQLEILRVRLTGLAKGDVSMKRRGGELHLQLGPYRRVVALPDTLVGRDVRRARVVDGELRVEFEPLGGAA
jgi:arsenite-transporting ATPase